MNEVQPAAPAPEVKDDGKQLPPENKERADSKAALSKINDKTAPAKEAPKAGEPTDAQKAAATEVKKWKLKFGDKEEEVDENELVKRAQKSWGIEQKAEKAANDRKLAEEFFQLAKSGDFSWLDKVGVNGRETISKWLVEQAIAEDEEKRLTPEQKQLREANAKLAKYQQAEEEKSKAERDATIKANTEKYTKEMQDDYAKACEENDLPSDNEVVQALTAQYLERAIKEGIVVTPKDVVPIVKKHIESLDNLRFDKYDGEKLVNWMGKNIEKVRKADLDKIKGIKPTPKDVKKEKHDAEQALRDRSKEISDQVAADAVKKNPNSFKEMIRESRRKWDELD